MTTWVLATTNCATNGRNKRRNSFILPLIALILFPAMLFAADETLNLYVDVLRFPTESGKTHVEINYQIPYSSMHFVPTVLDSTQQMTPANKVYLATVNVMIEQKKGDEYKFATEFPNKIYTRDFNATTSTTRYFLDKISLDIRAPLTLRITFMDVVTAKRLEWEQELTVLPAEEPLSDLELSSSITADTTSYLAKFHRNGRLFNVRADHIFAALECDTLFIYTQYLADRDMDNIVPQLIVAGPVMQTINFPPMHLSAGINGLETYFPLDKLKEGFYNIKFSLVENDVPIIQRTGWFILRESKFNTLRLFPSLGDEKILLSYFVPSSQMKMWDDLSESGMLNFLDRFWRSNDPDAATPENELYVMVQERIRFANEQYSKHIPGWLTDRGRVYIRNGAPDEIIKDTSSGSAPMNEDEDATPLSASGLMGARDYQIWKYYSKGDKKVYLFFDKQSSGDLKLIYEDGDDMEQGDPSWEYYMGSNFDETELSN